MRVLFTTRGSAGHLGPLVPYAAACRSAGHDVLVAAQDRFGPALADVPGEILSLDVQRRQPAPQHSAGETGQRHLESPGIARVIMRKRLLESDPRVKLMSEGIHQQQRTGRRPGQPGHRLLHHRRTARPLGQQIPGVSRINGRSENSGVAVFVSANRQFSTRWISSRPTVQPGHAGTGRRSLSGCAWISAVTRSRVLR